MTKGRGLGARGSGWDGGGKANRDSTHGVLQKRFVCPISGSKKGADQGRLEKNSN